MARVLIVCGSSISSQSLKESAQRSTEAYQADIIFESANFQQAQLADLEQYQLILIAPQADYDIQSLATTNVPVKQIPDDIYGWMNGESLVKFTMTELDKNKVAG